MGFMRNRRCHGPCTEEPINPASTMIFKAALTTLKRRVILLTLSLILFVFNRRQEEVLPTSSSSLGNFMARIETQRRLAIILRSAALSRLRVP